MSINDTYEYVDIEINKLKDYIMDQLISEKEAVTKVFKVVSEEMAKLHNRIVKLEETEKKYTPNPLGLLPTAPHKRKSRKNSG